MGKGRLEAFSDGVIAIIITIMVLEMKVPHDTSLAHTVPGMGRTDRNRFNGTTEELRKQWPFA